MNMNTISSIPNIIVPFEKKTLKNTKKKRKKRCPNGTRRNKEGNCEPIEQKKK